MMQATMQNLKLITIFCLQFSFCFHASDWLFPCNTITFMFTVIFYVHIKDVQVSAKVCAHLCILPIAGYPR